MKEISPGCSLEGLMLKLKLQYFGHAKSWLIGKDSDAGRNWGQEEKGTAEDEMAGWHHWLDGRESEWTPGVGDGQGGLACCDSWGHNESDTTEWLKWTELKELKERWLSPVGRPTDLGRGVAPLGRSCAMSQSGTFNRCPWPRTWGNSSWPPPFRYGVLPTSAPDLGRGVAPLRCALARPSQPPAL